jgi:hypothetical protein
LKPPVRAAPEVELEPVGWSARGELGYEEWLRQGSRLGVTGRNAAWWIGDWLRYGTARYGTKYTVAARVTGYDPQTLMNMVYVATRFEISRRRENLSWSHHGELAALEVAEQERWLDRATGERLSVRDLRDELAAWASASRRGAAGKRATSSRKRNVVALKRSSESTARTDSDRLAVCPQCGHEFVP